MPTKKVEFLQSMQPWPTLAEYGKHVILPDQDLKLFYFEAGSEHQQHLLMLHGLGDESDTWRHVFLPLAEDYHTLAVDLPGFGRSDKPDIKYTPQFMMDIALRFLDHQKINKTIIMGSSMGAILAHGLAIKHPNRLKALILIGGALLHTKPMKDWHLQLMQVPFLGEWFYTRLRKDPDAAYASLKSVYHQLEELPEADRKFLYTRVNQRVWSNGQQRAYFSALRNLSTWMKNIQKSLPDQLSQLNLPTLVIHGEHDRLFSELNADKIIEIQPKANKAFIPNLGHLPHQENPEVFLRVTRSWLRADFNNILRK